MQNLKKIEKVLNGWKIKGFFESKVMAPLIDEIRSKITTQQQQERELQEREQQDKIRAM